MSVPGKTKAPTRWYPNLQGLTDYDARLAVQRAWEEIYSLRDRLDALTAAKPITAQGLSDSIGDQSLAGAIRPSLQSAGNYPLNVQNLLGRTATNQWTFVPQLPVVPSLLEGVANVGDGTMITLTSPNRPPDTKGFKDVKRAPSGIPDGLLLRYNDNTHTFNPVQAIGVMMSGTSAEFPNPAYLSPGAMYAPTDRAKTIYIVQAVSPTVNDWFYWAGVWNGLLANRPTLSNTPQDIGTYYFATDQNIIYRWNGAQWIDWPHTPVIPGDPPWTAYTPTLSPGTPLVAGYSLAAYYSLHGKSCYFRIWLEGYFTAATTYIFFGLPFAARDSGFFFGVGVSAFDVVNSYVPVTSLLQGASVALVYPDGKVIPANPSIVRMGLSGVYELA